MTRMSDKVFTVELTERELATIFATADMEAKSCAMFAQRLRALPVMALSMAQEAAVFISIRDKMRAACPGLADAEIDGPPYHRESRA